MDLLPDTDKTPVNILLVDDRQENRRALQAILRSPEYRLVEASSGTEALRRLLDEEFAVLLVDILMPDMNGFEVATVIKQRERTAAVPIVFLTAQATDVEFVHRAYRVGAVDYLVKPLVPEMVRAKVAVFAEMYRQRKRIEHQSALLLQAERARAALLVQASEARFRRLFEDSPISMQIISPDGLTVAVNRAWQELWDVSQEITDSQVLGGAYNIFEDPQLQAKGIVASLRDAFKGEATTIPATTYDPAEIGKSGRARWVKAFVYPIKHADGSVKEVVLMHDDVTEQQQAEITLRLLAETSELLATSLERPATLERISTLALKYIGGACAIHTVSGGGALVDAVIACDDQTPAGAGLRRLLAADADAFGPKHVARIGRSEFIRRVGDAGNAPPGLIELLRARKANSYMCVPMFTRGRVWGTMTFVATAGNYSDEDLALANELAGRAGLALENASLFDTAQSAVHMREEFLSIASHELRTPLSSLRLQVDTLLRAATGMAPEAASDKPMLPKLQAASRQVDRLSDLIAELLDVSRIASGQLHLELESIDLAALASDVVSRFKEDALKSACELSLQASEPVLGRWDRLRIEQVVTNLLSNALKFGAGKPIEVTVTANGRAARIRVRDHGIGIASEHAARIFQRFERANMGRKYSGLGLGLYIVRQIVDAHGGTIDVESEPGQGALFTVELPLEPRD